jgi:hypothetical protein
MRATVTASVVLVLGAIMSGCNGDSKPAAQPTSVSPSPPPPADRAPSAKPVRPPTVAEPGGMTIRYLDTDGKIKTIRVEDFRR